MRFSRSILFILVLCFALVAVPCAGMAENAPDAENNELTEEEALAKAVSYLEEKFGVPAADFLAMETETHLGEVPETETYINEKGQMGDRITGYPRMWQIYFTAETGEVYTVWMYADGELKYAILSPKYEKTALDEALDDFLRDGRTVEGLANFRKTIAPQVREAIQNGETNIAPVFKYWIEIPYDYPDSESIPESEARQIAASAAKENGFTQEMLDGYAVSVSYRVYSPDEPEWRVAYYTSYAAQYDDTYDRYRNGEIPFGVVVVMDAHTGNVLSVTATEDVVPFNEFGEFPDPHDAPVPEEKSNG